MSKIAQALMARINGSVGLQAILEPIDSKVTELLDFASDADMRARELHDKAEELFKQGNKLMQDAQEARRIAQKLEEIVYA